MFIHYKGEYMPLVTYRENLSIGIYILMSTQACKFLSTTTIIYTDFLDQE